MAPRATIRNVAALRRSMRNSIRTLETNKRKCSPNKQDLMQTAVRDLLTADLYVLRALRILQNMTKF